MITQMILDALSQFVAGLIDLVPPLPYSVQSAVDGISSGLDSLSASFEPLGAVVPFEVIGGMLAGWTALLGFWAATVVARVVLWAIDR